MARRLAVAVNLNLIHTTQSMIEAKVLPTAFDRPASINARAAKPRSGASSALTNDTAEPALPCRAVRPKS